MLTSNLRCHNDLSNYYEPQAAAFNTFRRPAPNTRAGPIMSVLPKMHSSILRGPKPGNWAPTTAAAAAT